MLMKTLSFHCFPGGSFGGSFTEYRNEATGVVTAIPTISRYLATPTGSQDMSAIKNKNSRDHLLEEDTERSITSRILSKKSDRGDIHMAQVHYNSYKQKRKLQELLVKRSARDSPENDRDSNGSKLESPFDSIDWTNEDGPRVLKVPPINVPPSSESDSDSLRLRIQSIERYSRQSLRDDQDETTET